MAVSRASETGLLDHDADGGLESQIDDLRRRGHEGGRIADHRALTTLAMGHGDVAVSLALALALFFSWVAVREWIWSLWARMLDYWRHALGLPGHVAVANYDLGTNLRFMIPYLTMTAGPPNRLTWGVSAVGTLLVLLASLIIPRQHIPVIYSLRILASIQSTALAFFAIMPAAFPYNLPDYMADMLMSGYVLIGLVPILLGFTYYIFDFGAFRKLGLTLLMLLHLSLFIPLQYLLQVILLQKFSLLYMPICFMVFGLPLDVMVIVAFYGWGMSWRDRQSGTR